ncbi:MAG: hypothetical protein AB7K64_12420 [Variibacter sp.]
MAVTDTQLRDARRAHASRHGHPSARAIDAEFDIDNADFATVTSDRTRRNLLAAYKGGRKSADDGGEFETPKSVADLDHAAIWAKWNAAGRNRKGEDDGAGS